MRSGLAVLLVCVILAACSTEKSPISEPSGAAASVANVDWSTAVRIEVALSNYEFSPSNLVLQKGKPYLIHLENLAGGEEHTFTAPDFFRSVALRSDPAGQQALAQGGVVTLAAGESRDLYFVPLQTGSFDLECSEPLHPMFGMTGTIVVG
jgi:uncharacterized cupredoxin-like copper-binding protein